MRNLDTSSGPTVADERDLETLFRAEYTGMVRLAFSLIGDRAEAEEVVQEGFAEVHRRWSEIRQPGAYLRSAVVSRCRSVLRRRRLAERVSPEPPPGLPDGAIELWDLLDQLSDDQRVVVVLRFYGSNSCAEIARELDIPAPTVRSHLRRGLAHLREELTP